MAAVATVTAAAASTMQTINLVSSTTKVSATSTVRMGAFHLGPSRRAGVVVCAAGNPERIDNFVEGVKSDASKNAQKFGDSVAEAAGDVAWTVQDVGRDMGAKAQLAVDAASGKVDEAGDKANEVGEEVKTSTQKTVDSATDTK